MDDIPEELICPISDCVMDQCTVTPCGHRFHTLALLQWLSRRDTCPVDRATLNFGECKNDEDIETKAKEWTTPDRTFVPDLKQRSRHLETFDILENATQSTMSERIKLMNEIVAKGTITSEEVSVWINETVAELWKVARTIPGVDYESTALFMDSVVEAFSLAVEERTEDYTPHADFLEEEGFWNLMTSGKMRDSIEYINTVHYLQKVLGWPIDIARKNMVQAFMQYRKLTLVYGPSIKEVSYIRKETTIDPWTLYLLVDSIEVDGPFSESAEFIFIYKDQEKLYVAGRNIGKCLEVIVHEMNKEQNKWIEIKK